MFTLGGVHILRNHGIWKFLTPPPSPCRPSFSPKNRLKMPFLTPPLPLKEDVVYGWSLIENSRQRQDKKLERFCAQHNHISRKAWYLEKWISMAFGFLTKFDLSHGHISLKNENYHLKINSHGQFLNISWSFTKYLFQISP